MTALLLAFRLIPVVCLPVSAVLAKRLIQKQHRR